MPAIIPTIKVKRKRFKISSGEKFNVRCFDERLLNNGKIRITMNRAVIVAAKV
jgi:hypothetical protein